MKPDKLLTQREAAERLRISPKALQLLRRARRIAFVNFGHRSVRIRESEVEQFISRQERKSA